MAKVKESEYSDAKTVAVSRRWARATKPAVRSGAVQHISRGLPAGPLLSGAVVGTVVAAVTGGWATPEPAAYDSSVDRSSPSVAQSASDVSGALTPRAAEISADIYRLIVREIPQLRGR